MTFRLSIPPDLRLILVFTSKGSQRVPIDKVVLIKQSDDLAHFLPDASDEDTRSRPSVIVKGLADVECGLIGIDEDKATNSFL
ncbi:hypothetical protein GGD62_000826 [Bradyrhizobium sp. ERR14]|nr:hypothetical protein [Bradyrhizobium sp. ERR14]